MERMSDEEFIESVVMERMELCYSRWKGVKSSGKKDEFEEIEKAYEQVICLQIQGNSRG